MNAYYCLIRFSSHNVNGHLVPQAEDEEDARKQMIQRLIGHKKYLNYKHANGTHNPYLESELARNKSFLKCYTRHWRKTKAKGEPVLKIVKLEFPLECGFWMEEIITGQYFCNIAL